PGDGKTLARGSAGAGAEHSAVCGVYASAVKAFLAIHNATEVALPGGNYAAVLIASDVVATSASFTTPLRYPSRRFAALSNSAGYSSSVTTWLTSGRRRMRPRSSRRIAGHQGLRMAELGALLTTVMPFMCQMTPGNEPVP